MRVSLQSANGFRDFTQLSFSPSFLCFPLSFGAPRCGGGSFLGSSSCFLPLLISTIHHDSQTHDTQDSRLSTPTLYNYTSLLTSLLDRHPSFSLTGCMIFWGLGSAQYHTRDIQEFFSFYLAHVCSPTTVLLSQLQRARLDNPIAYIGVSPVPDWTLPLFFGLFFLFATWDKGHWRHHRQEIERGASWACSPYTPRVFFSSISPSVGRSNLLADCTRHWSVPCCL